MNVVKFGEGAQHMTRRAKRHSGHDSLDPEERAEVRRQQAMLRPDDPMVVALAGTDYDLHDDDDPRTVEERISDAIDDGLIPEPEPLTPEEEAEIEAEYAVVRDRDRVLAREVAASLRRSHEVGHAPAARRHANRQERSPAKPAHSASPTSPRPQPAGRGSSGTTPRLIGIGDLHGHSRALERILRSLHGKYAIFRQDQPDRLQRDVKLVFTGDYIDRGRHGLAIIERLRRLADQNPGQIVTLLGNHELMALEAYDDAKALLGRHQNQSARGVTAAYRACTTHGANGGTEFIREFGATSLPAFQSYVERMARHKDIGRWIRALEPSHRTRIAGRTVLFLHGDLPKRLRDKQLLERDLEWIDQHRKIATEDAGGSRRKWGHERLAGFFWDRTFKELDGASRAEIDALCRKVGVDFIVTGHTPHSAIKLYGKRIFDIDVGMTPACGEHTPQALVFTQEGIVGLDADGREKAFVRFGSAGRVGS